MDDRKCILVEFVNEDKKLAVGYRTWLEETKDDFNHIVKQGTEVTIRWPNCDVKSAILMRKCLKDLTKSDWLLLVVKILASGEWTEMSLLLSNMEKYGVLNPSKEERKMLLKRNLDEENNDNQPVHNTRLRSSSSTNKSNKKIRSVGILKQYRKVKDENRSLAFDVDDSSDDTNISCQKTKDLQQIQDENRVLKLQNSDYKKEIARLHSLLVVDKELPKLQEMIITIIKDIKTVESNVSKLSTRTTSLVIRENSLGKTDNTQTKGVTESKPHEIRTSIMSSPATDCKKKSLIQTTIRSTHQNIDKRLSSKDQTQANDIHISNSTLTARNNATAETYEDLGAGNFAVQEEKLSTNKGFSPTGTGVEETYIVENDTESIPMTNLGNKGVFVPTDKLAKCKRDNAAKMTCDLLSAMYSVTELATSSLTGKKANIHSKKTDTKPKPRLDILRLEAIKAHVLSEFPTEPDAEKKFYEAVRRKCNNASKIRTVNVPSDFTCKVIDD